MLVRTSSALDMSKTPLSPFVDDETAILSWTMQDDNESSLTLNLLRLWSEMRETRSLEEASIDTQTHLDPKSLARRSYTVAPQKWKRQQETYFIISSDYLLFICIFHDKLWFCFFDFFSNILNFFTISCANQLDIHCSKHDSRLIHGFWTAALRIPA